MHNNSTTDPDFDTTFPVGDDRSIEPDVSLGGYQDDFASGDDEDIVEEEQGTSPSDVTLMPESVLKEELDGLAIDEQPANPDDETRETTREHVEDMDEDDKDRSES